MNQIHGNVIKSLSRGLTALELVVEESTTPQSLAKSLDVDRTTAYRILNTLAAHDFVQRDPLDHQYVVNVRKIFSFAHSVVGKLRFPTLATPYLEKLRAKTGEAASLAVFAGRGSCLCQPSAERRSDHGGANAWCAAAHPCLSGRQGDLVTLASGRAGSAL